ncbi:hypothetical protein VFPFJ_07944 [Purpureocillium lilacinum]|uniref:Uncharacterized protein n=1 Tax=Purpureocillium lilacinum TaxID=33203 RepID=A0A179GJB0_PURLI|nr:hypothetical protein VFPFJ_07944 [Purpureocillium lilacinum]OAQ77433.1 hypothetical protein VFPBJ_07905 [Purpureocillium lilacinum]OAQ85555.1 hypothetical protein VFPFJ_07944 [Purpureocillium lilacinum]
MSEVLEVPNSAAPCPELLLSDRPKKRRVLPLWAQVAGNELASPSLASRREKPAGRCCPRRLFRWAPIRYPDQKRASC